MTGPAWRSSDGLVSLWLEHGRVKALSALTLRRHEATLGRFERWLGAPPTGATSAQLVGYLRARQDGQIEGLRPLSAAATRNEGAVLRAFYQWLQRFNYRTDDPAAPVQLPRLSPPAVRAIPDEILVEALDRAGDVDRAILVLAAFAGLRACEIAALTWADVDVHERILIIARGKGGRSRVVPLTQPVETALQRLPHRSGQVLPRSVRGGGPMTANAVTKRAGRVLGGRRAGGYSLHQLRHRWATVAYQQTGDLRAVQAGLGHSSPTTTAIYAAPHDGALREAAEAAAVLRPGARRTPPRLRAI